jgi:hypothetical protein
MPQANRSATMSRVIKQAGPEFAKVAAEKKIARSDFAQIQHALKDLPRAAKGRIQQRLRAGTLLKPEAVKREARKAQGETLQRSRIQPDLHEVLKEWTKFISRWRVELKAVEPYREYIDTNPVKASIFRKQVRWLIKAIFRGLYDDMPKAERGRVWLEIPITL